MTQDLPVHIHSPKTIGYVECSAGSNINDVISDVIKFSRWFKTSTAFVFNNTFIIVNPEDTFDKIKNDFCQKYNYLYSPVVPLKSIDDKEDDICQKHPAMQQSAI